MMPRKTKVPKKTIGKAAGKLGLAMAGAGILSGAPAAKAAVTKPAGVQESKAQIRKAIVDKAGSTADMQCGRGKDGRND
jgi:hypothetical protein